MKRTGIALLVYIIWGIKTFSAASFEAKFFPLSLPPSNLRAAGALQKLPKLGGSALAPAAWRNKNHEIQLK